LNFIKIFKYNLKYLIKFFLEDLFLLAKEVEVGSIFKIVNRWIIRMNL